MNHKMRKLNAIELASVAGGIPIGPGPRDFADNPFGPLPGGGSAAPIVLGGSPIIPLGGGGRDWWIVPGELNPIIPVPKPEPGKP